MSFAQELNPFTFLECYWEKMWQWHYQWQDLKKQHQKLHCIRQEQKHPWLWIQWLNSLLKRPWAALPSPPPPPQPPPPPPLLFLSSPFLLFFSFSLFSFSSLWVWAKHSAFHFPSQGCYSIYLDYVLILICPLMYVWINTPQLWIATLVITLKWIYWDSIHYMEKSN